MAVNRDKVDIWKTDVAKSVDFYNEWFMTFAPKAFRETRIETTKQVEEALLWTNNLTNIHPETLERYPSVLPMLRMTTCPPIARDRLVGLAGVSPNLVLNMERDGRVPPKMARHDLITQLGMIGRIIENMADPDIFVWKNRGDSGSKEEVHRASTIVADRLCGAVADPIIRNAQEQRQLAAIKSWLEARGYRELENGEAEDWLSMPNGTFSFRFNVPVNLGSEGKQVNIPVDAVIMRKAAQKGDFPALFEAKSAGDFTNTNKRRKEEAIKIQQLRNTYGEKITFDLFLCGYFDSGYLGYEAAEGIDWVWEHRIDDLEQFGF
ncbi:XamI family restriction endonuclease [Vibrio cholerae]|uniref:XamI family restriction endonuclease n=1 Tax=Vibrio cholerae TaxID=666 RepID=UPI0011577A39|nr:XamI family restriction endonuclease [Vibrio cholerae]EJL6844846.1 XamI family restriction endonuclease [Vibrio cholerae]TQQ43420.1 XamI family restriction endonuclease [Vibrio cholerae]HEQ3484868.1 XamI family restriction endonuclease [Vibrio cholerae]